MNTRTLSNYLGQILELGYDVPEDRIKMIEDTPVFKAFQKGQISIVDLAKGLQDRCNLAGNPLIPADHILLMSKPDGLNLITKEINEEALHTLVRDQASLSPDVEYARNLIDGPIRDHELACRRIKEIADYELRFVLDQEPERIKAVLSNSSSRNNELLEKLGRVIRKSIWDLNTEKKLLKDKYPNDEKEVIDARTLRYNQQIDRKNRLLIAFGLNSIAPNDPHFDHEEKMESIWSEVYDYIHALALGADGDDLRQGIVFMRLSKETAFICPYYDKKGALAQLNGLARDLAKEYDWLEPYALGFIVSDIVPTIQGSRKVRLEIRQRHDIQALSRIDMTIDPLMSPREVMSAYEEARNRLLLHYRPLSSEHAYLALFVSRCNRSSLDDWRSVMNAWNQHTDVNKDFKLKKYTNMSIFKRDAQSAKERLLQYKVAPKRPQKANKPLVEVDSVGIE